jgi:pimeloyl-ACP methyl ester carboxylesterase
MMRRRRLTAAVTAWVVWRVFGPRLPPRFSGMQVRPSRLPGRTVVTGRHEFLVRQAGPEGSPPLLLLHGWLYDTVATWHRVIPILSRDRRVVAVDLRNHGKTDRIQARFDVEDLADDVAGVLDALDLGAMPVVGYSLGGMTAQALARRHPGRVERLVLAATAAKPVLWPPALLRALTVAARALARIDPLVLPRIAHRYLLSVGAVAPEHSAWLWDTLADRDVDLYYEAAFAIGRFDAREWVGRLEVPTLCIIPTGDQLIPPALQRATAARIPGARVTEIEGARHEAVLTHAEQVAEAIRGFID